MTKRCSKGKSCGATCIERRDVCVLELGGGVSGQIAKVREKLRIGELEFEVRRKANPGELAKFHKIRKQLAQEVGGKLNKQEHILELKKRLQSEGLLPKSERAKTAKPEGLADIFNRNIQPKPKTAPAAPAAKEEPKSKGVITKLQDAMELGKQTRQEVGRDLNALKSEANRQREDLELEKMMARLGGEETRAASLSARVAKLNRALGQGGDSNLTGNTRWAREDSKAFDDNFKTLDNLITIKGSKDKINWQDSIDKGIKLGEGAFGTAMLVKGASPYVVKRGEISEGEAAAIKKTGELGIGPKLLYGELAGRKKQELGVFTLQGRIAMGLVPGKPIEDLDFGSGDVRSYYKVNKTDTVADAYFKARATLHKAGIAHNDAHTSNVLIDDKGKARFVDLGLAQANPKAALAEAIGVFATRDQLPRGAVLVGDAHDWGDFQALRFPEFGVARLGTKDAPATLTKMRENKTDVFNWLYRQKGFSRDEVAAIVTSGIRRPLSHYEKGAWGKLSNDEAQQLVNMLYEGIS